MSNESIIHESSTFWIQLREKKVLFHDIQIFFEMHLYSQEMSELVYFLLLFFAGIWQDFTMVYSNDYTF